MQLIGMDKTQKNLKKETGKWLERLQKARPSVRIGSSDPALQKKAKEALRNMDAYIKDTSHFLEKGDFIRAFEAIVWAWGILETLEHAGLVERK
ncbi:MAG TPA: DUF357 domain-containing protein [archaeon]|nr:DUF357 domain-containing protein [archaeon]